MELSDLTVLILKFGFLAVLWVFVLTAVGVMRRDLFGSRAAARQPAAPPPRAPRARESQPQPVAQPQYQPAGPPPFQPGPQPLEPQAAAPHPQESLAPDRHDWGGRDQPSSLVVTAGGLAGTALPLGDVPITLGRGQDNTLVLADDYASTRHARFYPQDGDWLVEDLGSTNGTYLDRAKLDGPTPVPIGVPVRIGKTVVELRT